MIANPIIRKEVLMTLRTRKAVAMQGLFLLILAALLWMNWPADGLQPAGGQKARQILSILAIGQLAMVALFAPAFTAGAITTEKERKTFDSLFSTTMRPWEIAVGKMVGSLTFLILVVVSGVPALAVPLLLGGISPTEVLAAMGLLLLTAVNLGAIGLFISTIMHRSYRAIILTYAVLLVVFFFLAIPAWPVSRNLINQGGPAWQAVLHVITSYSPLEAMISLVWGSSSEYAQGAAGMPAFWVIHIPLALATIVVAAVAVIARLHEPVAPPRQREKGKIVEAGFSARSIMFLVDPRKRKKMIRWWQNPILVKEFRTRPMLQAHWLIRSSLTCLIVSFVLMMAVNLSAQAMMGTEGVKSVNVGGEPVEQIAMIPTVATAVGVLMVVMIILLGPAMSSGAICSDRETGVWELIRATRLPSWRIASGKFQASIIPLVLLVLAMLPSLGVLWWIEPSILSNLLKMLVVVGTTVLFVSSAGMFFSSLVSRTSTATAWTYGLVISLGLLTLLTLLGEEAFSSRLKGMILTANPVAAVMDAAGSSAMQKYDQQFDMFGWHVKIMLGASAAMFVVTVGKIFQLRRPD